MRLTSDSWGEIKWKFADRQVLYSQRGTYTYKKNKEAPALRTKSRPRLGLGRRNEPIRDPALDPAPVPVLALHAPALRLPTIPIPRRAHLRYTRRPVLRAVRPTRRERYRCPRFDDSALVIIGEPDPTPETVVLGNSSGVASRGIAGIGIGSTHSSSSRSPSSADVVCEKLTAWAFRCGIVVFPVLSVWPGVARRDHPRYRPRSVCFSGAAREETRSSIVAPSPASRRSPFESPSSSGSCTSSSPAPDLGESLSSSISSSSSGSDIDSRLSSTADQDGGSSTIEKIVLCLLNN